MDPYLKAEGNIEENKLQEYVSKNRSGNLIIEKTSDIVDMVDKIDFYLTYINNNIPYKWGIDVKSVSTIRKNDGKEIKVVPLNFTQRNGETGTLGRSKADFIAIRDCRRDNGGKGNPIVDYSQFYFVSKKFIWDYIIPNLKDLELRSGPDQSKFYDIPIEIFNTQYWTFWINQYGTIGFSKYYEFKNGQLMFTGKK